MSRGSGGAVLLPAELSMPESLDFTLTAAFPSDAVTANCLTCMCCRQACADKLLAGRWAKRILLIDPDRTAAANPT